jgi:tetratricopeptide (TPR) repeat protein
MSQMLKSSGSLAECLRSSRNRAWLLGLLLVAATLLAYQPVWHAGFIWDDDAHLTKNPCIVGPLGLKDIWTTGAAVYYPLVSTSFWVQHAIWGLNPLPYHLVNVAMQASCAILLWWVLQCLGVRGAWFGAALWTLHPIQVESVAWITELKNTQSGFFYLLAILFFLKWRGAGGFAGAGGGGRDYGLTLLFATAAILSKASTVMLPVVLGLCWWWLERRWRWRNLFRLLPLLAISVAASGWTIWEQKFHSRASGVEWAQSWPERLVIAGKVVWFQLGKLLWPHPLIFIYPRWTISASQPAAWLPLMALLLTLFILWWNRNGRMAPAFFALVYFTVSLFPVLGFFNVYFFRYSFVGDHFQYLAAIGPLALAAAVGSTLFSLLKNQGRFWKPVVFGIVLTAMGILTWRQAGMYTDAETLWRTTIARNPDAWMAYDNLGIVFFQQGQVDQAIPEFQKALAIQPDDTVTRNNLGISLLLKGQEREAQVQFQKVLAIQPDDAVARNNLGQILLKHGQEQEALVQFQKVLENDPREPMANYNLGNFLLARGRVDEAIVYFQKSLAVRPDSVLARNNLGTALLLKGQEREALVQFQQALAHDSGDPTAHYNIGLILCQEGRMDEGIAQFQKALETLPGFAEAHNNLGNALLQKGLMDEAIAHFQKALEIRPDFADARDNLDNAAWLLATSPEASLRNGAKALALARQLNRLSGGNNPAMLDTLATACAESGQFPEAVDAAQRALALALAQNNTALAETLRQHIMLFQAGSPLRNAPQTEAAPGPNQP